ncbi:MAG: hypothetical protein HC828_01535 [Blastochloris sp.]|nr:hypothetical protein [Blastochloris sp.]
MDIGMVMIHVTNNKAIVSRWEEAQGGIVFIPALNAAALEHQALEVLEQCHHASLDHDGVYLCTDQLQEAAQFPPFSLPADAITYGEARRLLYPDVAPNTGWQRISRAVQARKLRVWRVGIAMDARRYLSRAEVMQLKEEESAVAV